MDDFETILKRVPAEKRDAVLAWYNNVADAYKARALADLGAKYPGLPAVPTIGPQTVMRGITPTALSPTQSFLAGASQGLTLGGSDELAGLQSQVTGGVPYEAARQLAAASLAQSRAEHPVLYHTGEFLGGGIGLLGGEAALTGLVRELGPQAVQRLLTPAITKGASGALARGALTGGTIGAVSGALNATPGNRLMGAAIGVPLGGLGGVAGAGAGSLMGHFAGTPAARAARDLAEAGEVNLPQAMRQAAEASPDAPVAAADYLGPSATSLVRKLALTPGPAQRVVTDFFRNREAQTPQRIVGAIEDFSGAAGLNPHAAAEQLAQARSAEAANLYGEAYASRPTSTLAQMGKVPRIQQAVNALRQERVNAGIAVPKGAPTVEEFHDVRKILDAQSRALGAPGATSAEQTSAYIASTLRDQLDAGLKTVPGFAKADQAFRTASGLMAHYSPTQSGTAAGTNFLQTDPALAEHMLATATPDERRMVLLGLPASVAREANTAAPRSLLGRLGIGQGAKFGRARAIDALAEHFPDAEARLTQLGRDEETMRAANQAASAATTGSSTVPNLMSAMEHGAANVVFPSLRGELFGVGRGLLRGLSSRPNPEADLAAARLVTTTGAPMRELLSDAALSQVDRDARRIVGRRLGAALAPGLTGLGVEDTQGRQDAAQSYYDDLRTHGATDAAARQLAQTRFGVTVP